MARNPPAQKPSDTNMTESNTPAANPQGTSVLNNQIRYN